MRYLGFQDRDGDWVQVIRTSDLDALLTWRSQQLENNVAYVLASVDFRTLMTEVEVIDAWKVEKPA